MEVDYNLLLQPPGWKAVANLPYQVGTPLLLDWLRFVPALIEFTVMVQLEVAQRLTASAGSDAYGLPSVVVGLHAKAELAFKVPPQVFYPAPRVESAVVRMIRRPAPKLAEEAIRLAAAGFGQRRKMLRGCSIDRLGATNRLPGSSGDRSRHTSGGSQPRRLSPTGRSWHERLGVARQGESESRGRTTRRQRLSPAALAGDVSRLVRPHSLRRSGRGRARHLGCRSTGRWREPDLEGDRDADANPTVVPSSASNWRSRSPCRRSRGRLEQRRHSSRGLGRHDRWRSFAGRSSRNRRRCCLLSERRAAMDGGLRRDGSPTPRSGPSSRVAVVVPPFELATRDVYQRWDRLGEPKGPSLDGRQLPPSLRASDRFATISPRPRSTFAPNSATSSKTSASAGANR